MEHGKLSLCCSYLFAQGDGIGLYRAFHAFEEVDGHERGKTLFSVNLRELQVSADLLVIFLQVGFLAVLEHIIEGPVDRHVELLQGFTDSLHRQEPVVPAIGVKVDGEEAFGEHCNGGAAVVMRLDMLAGARDGEEV